MKKIIMLGIAIITTAILALITLKIYNQKNPSDSDSTQQITSTTGEIVTTETKTEINTETYEETNTDAQIQEASPTDTTIKDGYYIDNQLPNKHNLQLNLILQNPELPAGCESVSLTMLINYYGYKLKKTYIADNHLVYSNNFVLGYTGDPYSSTVGGGCYAPGMTDSANSFLDAIGSDYYAENITGTEFDQLFRYIAGGTPVMVWTTIAMSEPSKGSYQCDNLGNSYAWDYMEHCVVLAGYDLQNNTVTIYDPIDGIVERDLDRFQYTYEAMYKMALILKKH